MEPLKSLIAEVSDHFKYNFIQCFALKETINGVHILMQMNF